MAATMDRRFLMKVAGGSTAAMLAGAAPVIVVAQDTAAPTGELIIGKGQEAVGFDPAIVTASSSFDLIAIAYERLVEFDEAGDPQPVLAESWETPDDLTYVFTLRPNVTFHNGKTMTADDVKFTFDRIKAERTASPWASQFASVDEIEATDDKTVTFRLNAPYGPFLATLSAAYASIVPKDDTIDLQAGMVGTGAFKLDTWEQDIETVMVAHAGYWNPEQPKVETLRWRILPEESTRLAAVHGGEIHITSISLNAKPASESESVTMLEQETTDYYLLGFNTAEPPFDDVKVRQAMSLAIDRQAIVEGVLSGRGQVTGPIVPTLGDWAQPVEQLPNYTVDRDKARALLEEAGVTNLTFSILVDSLYAEFGAIAQLIQDQLATIGVTAELEQVEWGTFIDRWSGGDFQSFVSFNSSGNDPHRALYLAFTTDGSANVFQFSDKEIDRLLESGRTTTDPDARKTIYQNVEVALAEAAPVIFISTRVVFFAVRDAVRGFQPTAAQTWLTLRDATIVEG